MSKSKFHTVTKQISETEKLTVKYGIDSSYFSITGEITERGKLVTCGAIHEEIVKHFPEFAELVKYHLVGSDGTPMHYYANGLYWFKQAIGIPCQFSKTVDPKAKEHFAHTVIMEDGEHLPLLSDIMIWLTERLPRVQSKFFETMGRLNVLVPESREQ